jgi:hypothetical protein
LRSLHLCVMLLLTAMCVPAPGAPPAPSDQMQKLLRTLGGTWSITYTLEPTEQLPKGGTGAGREVFRPGPGGASLVEEFRAREGTRDVSGLGLAWWDESAQGFRAVWCSDDNPAGCGVMSGLARFDGADFVLTDEFEMMGKKMAFKEVFSNITTVSFTQTLYQGEAGSELKKIMTVQATKLTRQALPAPGRTQ